MHHFIQDNANVVQHEYTQHFHLDDFLWGWWWSMKTSVLSVWIHWWISLFLYRRSAGICCLFLVAGVLDWKEKWVQEISIYQRSACVSASSWNTADQQEICLPSVWACVWQSASEKSWWADTLFFRLNYSSQSNVPLITKYLKLNYLKWEEYDVPVN